MGRIVLILFSFLIILSAPAAAEDSIGTLISPGGLASAHSKYEGILNCVKCHKLGKGVPDSTCLDCHDKLAKRIQNKEGLHAKFTETCIKCHGDHKGRSYKMISVEKDKFDHDRTDYRLRDKHAEAKCDKCHKKQGVYTGLKQECNSCHDDEHKKQLDQDCARCHNFKGWKDIAKFEHNTFSKYLLTGKHIDVKCAKCHERGTYKPIENKKCDNCHKDAHRKQFADKACDSCHTTRSWKTSNFDHSSFAYIGYRLEGKHLKVDCAKCHVKGRYKPLDYKKCDDCHKDPHRKQFPDRACDSCHDVIKDWKTTGFDHNSADYKGYRLEGKHQKVDCAKCHAQGKFKPIESKKCDDCHKDPHRKQFPGKNCEACHDVVKDWKSTGFDHNGADYKGYRLEGKHQKVNCEKCHIQGKFKPIESKKCDDCHKDPHKKQFANKACEACHDVVKDWKTTSFDHNSPQNARYRLDGKHLKVNCGKCHADGKYRPLDFKKCEDCHKDPHKKQFQDRLCEACHTTKEWKTTLFDHNAGEYKGYRLEGKHVKTPCEKCHVDGKYKPIQTVCQNCHEKDDAHKDELGKVCKKCHNEETWKKSTMDHNLQTRFPLVGKHRETQCDKCHKDKKYRTKAEKCIDCHKDVHKGEFKEECSSCHTQFDWQPRKFDHKKKAGFELRGVHNDVICSSCHVTKEYKKVNRYCNQCHVDPHLNQFGVVECEKCHDQRSWNPADFRHSATSFPLIGNHRSAECQACHANRLYRNTPVFCYNCHASNYMSASGHVANGYSTDCKQCHPTTFTSWAFSHLNLSSGCSSCHLSLRPSSHVSNPTLYPTTCEQCHYSTSSWTLHRHSLATTGCATCHLSYSTPARPADHTTNNWTVCETCHKSTSAWTFTHTAVSTGCATCHLNSSVPAKPADHTTNNWTVCETCHKSTSAWTFTHPAATTGCSVCHLNYSTPAKPADHVTNNWTVCETCHKSKTAWTFTHPATTFPLNHRGTSPSDCNACHPGGAYTNKGGCIQCHTSRGVTVHRTSSNAGCLSCHPTGQK